MGKVNDIVGKESNFWNDTDAADNKYVNISI